MAQGLQDDRRLIRLSVDVYVMIAVITLIAWMALRLLHPFLGILLWALILAVALNPVFLGLRKRLGGRSAAAAGLIGLLGLVVLLAPMAAAVDAASSAVSQLAVRLQGGELRVPPPAAEIRDWPLIGGWLFDTWNVAHEDMQAALAPWLQDLRAILTRMGSSLLLGVLQFAASIVLAAVFLANGEALGQFIRQLATRLGGARAATFADSATATIRNVSRGVIGVALAQGVLAALGFYAAGVPAAGTLSFLTVGAAIIQFPVLIILPAILWVWHAEPSGTAMLFTAWMLPVMLLDNVLKPILMGRGLNTPMILILLGVIGGTLTLGLIGLFIGPVVLAVFYDMILLWLEEPEAETAPEDGEAAKAAEAAE